MEREDIRCFECAGRLGLQTLDPEAEGCRRSAVRTKEKEQLSVLQMAWRRRDTVGRYLKWTWTFEPDEEEQEGGLCEGAESRSAYGCWRMTRRSAGAREVWRVRPGTGEELVSDPSSGTLIRRFLQVSQ